MAIYKNKIGKIIVEKVENIFLDPKYEEYRKFYKKRIQTLLS
jgi:hypothetical protein